MSKSMAQTARYFTPFEEQLRVFTRQQDELQRELYQEKEFLKKAGHYHVPDLLDDFDIIKGKEDDSKQQVDEALAKQLNLLNERLDRVVKSLEDRQKSMYIREEDEESEISEIPLQYDEAPVTDERPIIEKLNFSMLSNRTPVPADEYQTSLDLKTPTPISENSGKSLSTAQSFENPLFAEKNPKIPIEWMKLLPLEAGSARYADNLLTYNKSKEDRNVDISTPKQEHFYKTPSYLSFNGHKSVTERGVGTQNSARIGETQTAKNDDVANRKTVDLKAVRRMSQEDMKDILDRVVKY